MEIIEKKISEIVPYERNPRNNEKAVDFVKASIEEFGFKNPIIIDANNVIIAGHTRLLAAKELGLKKVPCIVASDLDEEQVKAFRLADNKTAEFASWDFEMLEAELEDINIDMTEFGFEELGDIGVKELDDFKEFDEDIETENCCPKCGYRW